MESLSGLSSDLLSFCGFVSGTGVGANVAMGAAWMVGVGVGLGVGLGVGEGVEMGTCKPAGVRQHITHPCVLGPKP
jgi:hypothetical protein